MPSVSRLGEATEPASRWSRPITIGALTAPVRTSSLKARPIFARSPYPSQQIRAGNPCDFTCSRAMWIQRARALSSGNVLQHRVVRDRQVCRVAGEGRPAERPLALAEERPDVRGHEAGEGERVLHTGLPRLGADVVAVVERQRPRAPSGPASPARARPCSAGPRPCSAAGSAARRRERLLVGHPVGDVAVQRIVGAGLVGDEVGHHAARAQHSGSTSAALPSRPMDSARPADCASLARGRARRPGS